MIAVGLTGGIASGKSEVAAMLAAKGAAVIYADQIGHEAYRRGTDEYFQIVAAFGAEVIGEDGEIDRRRLVFPAVVHHELDKVREGINERFIVDAGNHL